MSDSTILPPPMPGGMPATPSPIDFVAGGQLVPEWSSGPRLDWRHYRSTITMTSEEFEAAECEAPALTIRSPPGHALPWAFP